MKFSEKLKCIFEMLIIFIILLVAGRIIFYVSHYVIYGLIPVDIIWRVISKLITLALIIFGTVIFIHLFKIRYLDYFVTIEDENVTEKTIEQPIDKKENKYYTEKLKEKIIIRDPKHTTLNLFKLLGKIIEIIIKILIIFAIIPVIICFVVAIGLFFASLFHMQYSILFFFIGIALLGVNLLIYDIIELLYNAIVDKEEHYKRMFIIAIIGLIMCGAGGGLATCEYLNYPVVNTIAEEQYLTQTANIEMSDNLYISKNEQYEYEIDNSLDNIIVEIKYINGSEAYVGVNVSQYYGSNIGEYRYLHVVNYIEPLSKYKLIINDLKNKVTRNYNLIDNMKVKIKISQDNLNKLKDFQSKIY